MYREFYESVQILEFFPNLFSYREFKSKVIDGHSFKVPQFVVQIIDEKAVLNA
jgi:hypothetical protein